MSISQPPYCYNEYCYLIPGRQEAFLWNALSALYLKFLVCFKSLWTQVSCCVQKASRRVYYIGLSEQLIGRYGLIATRYVNNTARYA